MVILARKNGQTDQMVIGFLSGVDGKEIILPGRNFGSKVLHMLLMHFY